MVDQTRCSSRSACTNLGEAWRRRRSVGFFRLKPSDAESKAAGARLAPAPHRCESLEADVARDLDHQRPNCRDARLHGCQRRRLYDPRVDPPTTCRTSRPLLTPLLPRIAVSLRSRAPVSPTLHASLPRRSSISLGSCFFSSGRAASLVAPSTDLRGPASRHTSKRLPSPSRRTIPPVLSTRWAAT